MAASVNESHPDSLGNSTSSGDIPGVTSIPFADTAGNPSGKVVLDTVGCYGMFKMSSGFFTNFQRVTLTNLHVGTIASVPGKGSTSSVATALPLWCIDTLNRCALCSNYIRSPAAPCNHIPGSTSVNSDGCIKLSRMILRSYSQVISSYESNLRAP